MSTQPHTDTQAGARWDDERTGGHRYAAAELGLVLAQTALHPPAALCTKPTRCPHSRFINFGNLGYFNSAAHERLLWFLSLGGCEPAQLSRFRGHFPPLVPGVLMAGINKRAAIGPASARDINKSTGAGRDPTNCPRDSRQARRLPLLSTDSG